MEHKTTAMDIQPVLTMTEGVPQYGIRVSGWCCGHFIEKTAWARKDCHDMDPITIEKYLLRLATGHYQHETRIIDGIELPREPK